MFIAKNLNPNSEEDIVLRLSVNYYYCDSWVQCGMSRVNGYIKALGFRGYDEAKAFINSAGVFESFADTSWMRGFVSAEDAKYLAAQCVEMRGKSNRVYPFLGDDDLVELRSVKDGVIPDSPTYALFYQILFSWFTNWDNGTNREKFINWWYSPTSKDDGKAYLARWNYAQSPMSITAPVLKSFQDKVNTFLDGKYPPDYVQPGIVDAIHGIESAVIGLALKPSKWKYVSGDDIGITAETPILNVGASGAVGYYYFYSNDSPNTYYPVKFGQLMLSAGVSLIPTPVSGSINLSSLPALGTLFQGWQNINKVSDLQGLYFYISGSVGLIGNVNNSLIFFLPVGSRVAISMRQALADAALIIATIITTVGTSKAVMTIAANGLESIFGAGVGIGYGYSTVGDPIEKSKSHWKTFHK